MAFLPEWRLPGEVVLAAVLVLVAVLARLVIGVVFRRADDDDLEAEARRWIGNRIDEHLDSLARAWAQRGAKPEDLPPGFAVIIETFIAEVLLRRQDRADVDLDLGLAVQEFVVLHRDEVYEEIARRTRQHLATA